MSKQSISWLLVVIVAIGIIFFVFIRPSTISSPNGAAVITTEAERQAMIDKINADIANYQKLIDELNVQIKDVQNTPTPIPPTFTPTVTVTPTTSTLAKSKTLQLTASYKDETGAVVPKTFTWSTSSGTIATVSSKGLVTARNVGTATITATTGTVKGTASITVTVPDTTRPNVSITSPKAGTVSGTIDVTATASDNVAVTKVEIYSKNGTTNALVKTFTAPPYTVSINTTLSTDGARYLTAKAYDAAGNSRTSTAVSITIKNAVATPTGSCPTTIPSNSFLSCFYSYSSAANFGSFLASRTGTTIDYNWGALSPMTGVPIDLFSMRSTGNFTFESATYTFTHTGDDGTRLFIDNVKVDEQWNDHSATTYTIDKTMTAGVHKVTFEYYENGGDAVAALSWAKKVVDAVACTTAPTETQTSACPSGQTGTVTKTRTTSPAPACTLSAWVTTDTCVDVPAQTGMQISASPSAITAGNSSTITYSANSSTFHNVRINGSTPQNISCGTSTCGGSYTVNPTSTTTYTMTATYADGSTAPSTSTTITVTGTPPPPPPPTSTTADTTTIGPMPPITMPNEPGFDKIAENAFNCVDNCNNGWSVWEKQYGAAITLNNIQATPFGDSKSAQMNFDYRTPPGSSPGSITPAASYKKEDIYVATWIKLSPDYFGNESGVNKILHFDTHVGSTVDQNGDGQIDGTNVAIFNFRGGGNDPILPGFLLQGLRAPYTYTDRNGGGTYTGREINLDPPSTVCETKRGQWYRYEMILHNNTSGQPNGYVKLWQNDKLCVDQSGLTFTLAQEENKWARVWWSPTWGGGGAPITGNFEEWMDHMYVSGK